MNSAHPLRLLLGPQVPERNLTGAVASAGLPDGPLAVISAGWQEAEGDIDDVAELVGRPLEDLHLYQRSESVTEKDPNLAAATRQRQDQLIAQQRLYRLRLKQLSIAARRMLSADGDPDMLAAEQRHAIAQLRALDRHHLHRSESIWRTFSNQHDVETNASLANHAQQIGAIIDRSVAVLITGGNVAVMLNRMRLFGVDRLLEQRPIIAWSAGAMVLADRIVLYHERSPEGRREAEVLGAGCGIVPGYVFLPDTNRRLRSNDRLRVGLMCRRFSPDTCIALDNGAELHVDDSGVIQSDKVRRLNHDGRLVRLRAA